MLINEEAIEEYANEFKILKAIKHPYIIEFFDGLILNNKLCFLMEYAEKGTLDQFIKNPYSFGLQSPDTLISIAQNIISGILFLQKNKIVHRDLKPENILLTKDFQAKIGDLGLSKFIATNQALKKNRNLKYAALEKKNQQPINKIWFTFRHLFCWSYNM
ncbi:hypothetical protein ABPG72_008546 [Tetrahymena utriculariae]